jgi:hypothetical protein
MNNVLDLKYGLGQNTAVPNVIARSSIFSSHIYRGVVERPFASSPFEIEALGGTAICQTAGYRLDQSDAEVFYEVMRAFFSRIGETTLSLRISIERTHLLSSIGRKKGGKTNLLLRDSLDRLSKVSFDISEACGRCYTVGIFQSVTYPGENHLKKKHVEIEIDQRLIELYTDNRWTLLKKTELCGLKSPIARALYAYYKTHNDTPYALLPCTVKKLVGRVGMQDSKWFAQLCSALDELRRVTSWEVCGLEESGVRAGKVVVVKRASKQCARRKDHSKLPRKVHIEDDDI